jgi:phosphoribosyl-dephospho-CoA transferase
MHLERPLPSAAALPGVHCLLRVSGPQDLLWVDEAAGDGLSAAALSWTEAALQRLPFVVVRRHMGRTGHLPVGVRGLLRSQRAPAWLPVNAVTECITPQDIAAAARWRIADVCSSPAVAVLNQVEAILSAHGLADRWGPGGSVGAELASGVTSTTVASDLDLLLYVDTAFAAREAKALHASLSTLPVRIDTLLETQHGAVALEDFIGGADKILLRTAQGPRLVPAPAASV